MLKYPACALVGCGLLLLTTNINEHWTGPTLVSAGEKSDAPARLALHERRQSELDLAVGGELAGLPAGTTRYISRAELLKLPQVTYTVSDDANFKSSVEISGVLLEEVSKALAVPPAADLVVAICQDQYRASYPLDYVRAHHPVLVLKINGQGPEGWPKNSKGHGAKMAPFLVSHEKFTPSFRIFAHEDEPQIPWGVVRLEFREERSVFSAIAPRGPRAGDANVQAGFRIAKQNCFRCHNMGDQGGKKSGRPWLVIAAWAAAAPEHFASYVRRPQENNPNSQMAASPQYDDATMRALIDYFETFVAQENP